MSDLQRFTLYGECKKGTEHKYYEVEAEELEDGRARWTFRWARIGYQCSKPKTGVTYDFANAKAICEAQFTKKRKYKEVSPLEALASAAQTVEDRADVNGLPAVELEVPTVHPNCVKLRLWKFFKKYNTKLNVIRASRHDLGIGPYRKQIETMLKQYGDEYERIKGTQAHGPYLGDDADEAKITFYNALRENAGIRVMSW